MSKKTPPSKPGQGKAPAKISDVEPVIGFTLPVVHYGANQKPFSGHHPPGAVWCPFSGCLLSSSLSGYRKNAFLIDGKPSHPSYVDTPQCSCTAYVWIPEGTVKNVVYQVVCPKDKQNVSYGIVNYPVSDYPTLAGVFFDITAEILLLFGHQHKINYRLFAGSDFGKYKLLGNSCVGFVEKAPVFNPQKGEAFTDTPRFLSYPKVVIVVDKIIFYFDACERGVNVRVYPKTVLRQHGKTAISAVLLEDGHSHFVGQQWVVNNEKGNFIISDRVKQGSKLGCTKVSLDIQDVVTELYFYQELTATVLRNGISDQDFRGKKVILDKRQAPVAPHSLSDIVSRFSKSDEVYTNIEPTVWPVITRQFSCFDNVVYMCINSPDYPGGFYYTCGVRYDPTLLPMIESNLFKDVDVHYMTALFVKWRRMYDLPLCDSSDDGSYPPLWFVMKYCHHGLFLKILNCLSMSSMLSSEYFSPNLVTRATFPSIAPDELGIGPIAIKAGIVTEPEAHDLYLTCLASVVSKGASPMAFFVSNGLGKLIVIANGDNVVCVTKCPYVKSPTKFCRLNPNQACALGTRYLAISDYSFCVVDDVSSYSVMEYSCPAPAEAEKLPMWFKGCDLVQDVLIDFGYVIDQASPCDVSDFLCVTSDFLQTGVTFNNGHPFVTVHVNTFVKYLKSACFIGGGQYICEQLTFHMKIVQSNVHPDLMCPHYKASHQSNRTGLKVVCVDDRPQDHPNCYVYNAVSAFLGGCATEEQYYFYQSDDTVIDFVHVEPSDADIFGDDMDNYD